jgi:CHAT domain-containing protein
MSGIPLEFLQDDSGTLLCERYAVSYAPSSTVFASLRERPGREPEPILLVGDPALAGSLGPSTRWQNARHEVLRGALRGDPAALADLPPLQGTREEIRRIASVCMPATVLTGVEASEDTLSRLAAQKRLAEFGTLHLATHALVDDQSPERSALVLSQRAIPPAFERVLSGRVNADGLLRAEEIALGWKLDADLVTLSACETGLGREAGGEGVLGLAYAFLQAGARSLLVSLWKVDDEATSLLMQRFYENRAGLHGPVMSKSRALQQARLYLRSCSVNGHTPYEDPFYWAGFILIGDAGSER